MNCDIQLECNGRVKHSRKLWLAQYSVEVCQACEDAVTKEKLDPLLAWAAAQ